MEQPRFRVLGPIELADSAGRPVTLGGRLPRTLGCALLAEAGRVVSTDRLIERMWGGNPPPTATGTLHAYVSKLRAALEPDRRGNQISGIIATRNAGYLLRAAPEEVDATLFAMLVDQAETAPPAEALANTDAALALWRGEAYVDLGDASDLASLRQPLRELRLRARELRAGALSALDRTAPATDEAQTLVREYPLRESYWRLLMLASYRQGRQADALAAYASCRRILDEELGIAPSPETDALQLAILRHDPALSPPTTLRATATTTRPGPPTDDLVGRDSQLAVLGAALDAVHDSGAGRLVMLEGEAGIGKTRLAEAARDLAEARGIRTVWSSTMRDMAAPSLWPWEQVLRGLDLPLPSAGEPGGPGEPGNDHAGARFRLCQQIADAVLTTTRDRPLLIVLDDLHWADVLSLQVLRLLSAQLTRHRCVLVATRRVGDHAEDPAVEAAIVAVEREPRVRRVQLPPLTPDQVETLLTRTTADGLADPATLHRRTGGNLFYLVELLRLLRQEGPSAEVPRSVRSVVEQRYDLLPDRSRVILQLAALGGEELDLRVLAHATGTDTPDLVGALEPAQRCGLLRRDSESLRWRFTHDIARQALVSRLGPAERARLHGTLAGSIEGAYGAGSARHLDDLAQHLFHAAHGTTSEAAFVACTSAADNARARLAPDRAARHRERALAVLPDEAGVARRFRTLLDLAEERGLTGDNGGSTTAIAEALGLAGPDIGPDNGIDHGTGTDQGPDHTAILEAATMLGRVTLWTWELPPGPEAMVIAALRALLATDPGPAHRAALLGTLAQRLDLAGAPGEEVERTADDSVAIARRIGDPALLGRALNSYVRAIWRPEREAQRLAATEEALGLVGHGLPVVTEIVARMHRMPILLRQGLVDECARELAMSGELARTVGVPEAEAHASYQQITLDLLRGDLAGAHRGIDAAYRQYGPTGFSHAELCRVSQRAGLARAAGRLGDHARELAEMADTHVYGECLRPTAVLASAQAGDHYGARRQLGHWGLEQPPTASAWFTDFTTVELGEVAARLGTPEPGPLYATLLPRRGTLTVLGTLLSCGGATDLTLTRLAHRLGHPEAARRHLDEATTRYGHLPGLASEFTAVRVLLTAPAADRH